MTRHLAAAVILAVVGIATPAKAQGTSSSLCPEVADTPRGRACLQTELAAAERGLALAWRDAFAFFGGSRKPAGAALLAEQRVWIAYKDKACALYFGPGLSAMEWSNGMRCKMRVIHARSAELDRMKADFPGLE